MESTTYDSIGPFYAVWMVADRQRQIMEQRKEMGRAVQIVMAFAGFDRCLDRGKNDQGRI